MRSSCTAVGGSTTGRARIATAGPTRTGSCLGPGSGMPPPATAAREPVQVIAVFGRGNTRPHLRGAAAGMWPCQVTNPADAERQEPILRAIVECELHERIFQGSWRVIPAFTGQDGGAAS